MNINYKVVPETKLHFTQLEVGKVYKRRSNNNKLHFYLAASDGLNIHKVARVINLGTGYESSIRDDFVLVDATLNVQVKEE